MRAAPRLAAAVAATLALVAGAAAAAELVMVEVEGCAWCVKWHREIGPVYAKTEEGRRLPLRRQAFAEARGVAYTPTFLLMECGREVGRIVGYAGEDAFWGELGALIARLPAGGCPNASP